MEKAISPTTAKTTVVKYPQFLDFPTAMRHIILGNKIHKLEWKDKEYYGYLFNGFLSLHKPDGTNHRWIVSDGDMIGNDYIIL